MMPMYQFQHFVPPQSSQKLHTLYVGDLEDQIDDQTLFNFFQRYGNILQLKIVRDFETRRSKGFGFVSFSSQKEGSFLIKADKARLEMNHKVIFSNPLRVCNKKHPQELSPDANIVVKNIPTDASAAQVDSLFKNFGEIFSSRLIQKTGVAFVQFEQKESVNKCLEVQQQQPLKINNYTIQVFPFQKRLAPSQNTNIYLKNFPQLKTEIIEQTLKSYCAQFGPLSSLLVKPHSDLSLPFAFVCFEQKEHAQLCFENLKVNPPYPNLYANWAETRQERNKKLKNALSQIQNETNLFVKNLKQIVTRDLLLERMTKYGQITSCEVRLPETKGQQMIVITKYGYINYKNKEDARNALLLARDQPDVKELFQDAQVYINYHLSKSQSQQYQNMRKNKFPAVPNLIQSVPQMMYPTWDQFQRQGMPVQVMQPMQTLHSLQTMPTMLPPIQMQPIHHNPNINAQNIYRPKTQAMPVKNAPKSQPAIKPKEFGSYEQIKKNKEVFCKKPVDYQRTVLGELLFPMIQDIIGSHKESSQYVPKITGMLIDFSVFEVDDILELFDDKEALRERVQEAVDLIQQNQQN